MPHKSFRLHVLCTLNGRQTICLCTRCLHQIRHTSLNSEVCIWQFGKGKYTFIAHLSSPLMNSLITCCRFGKSNKFAAKSRLKFFFCQVERQTDCIPCIGVDQFRTMHIDIHLIVKSALRSQVFNTTLSIILIKINLVYLKEIAFQYNEFRLTLISLHQDAFKCSAGSYIVIKIDAIQL